MHNYKLYRNLKDIIVPSISRKNISNYKVVIDNDILPIEVYYPNKNIKLENIIIYIPRDNKTTNLYNDLAINTNNLVIVLDYDSNKKNYYNTIKYIYNNTDNIKIKADNITIMSDNEGSDIEKYIINKSIETSDFKINKSILLEPTISLKDKNLKNSLIVINQDNDNKKLFNCNCTKMYLDDFFNGNSTALNNRIYSEINDYIGG